MKNYFLPEYLTKSEKAPKIKSSKTKSNSLNSKKLILSRNSNIPNNNLILKTKTNNNNITYKQILSINNQLSPDSKSLNHLREKDDTVDHTSLYRYLESKIKENNIHLNQRKNKNNNNSKLYSTKLDFSMNNIISISKPKKDEKNKFNKYKGINKANKTSKNYYKKILNLPLSPGNKHVKLLKLNNINNIDNLDIHEVANSFNYINKEKNDLNYKRLLSSHNLIKNKRTENNNKINSFIYNNTNNINLNVNIINKGIILNSFNNNNFYENKNNNSSMYYNNILTHQNKNKHNKEIITISSYNNKKTINKENINTPEEIHFQSVKYMQEILNVDRNYT